MLGLIDVGWLGGRGENEDAFIMIEYVIKAVLSHTKQMNKWGMAHIRLEDRNGSCTYAVSHLESTAKSLVDFDCPF